MSSKISTFLYKTNIDLVLLEGNRFNLPMYHKNAKIFKGVSNKIDFTLTNSDRKPIKLLDGIIKMFIFDNITNEVIFEKYAEIIDEIKGRYQVIIEKNDLEETTAGFYRFSIVYTDFDEFEQILYTDFTQGSTGTIEVVNDSTPMFKPATQILESEFKIENNYRVSGRYSGDNQKSIKDTLHTVFFYFTNYTGDFSIQGSLEEYPSTYEHYFDIITQTVTDQTDVLCFNFTGNYPWIRFKYQPDPNLNTGSVDKILLKS